MKSRMLLTLSRLGTVHPIRSATMRPNSVITSSEQVGNVSTWHLLQLRVPLGSVVHVAGRDVARVLVEPEVEHPLSHPLGIPAVLPLGENPVQGEPVALGSALERRRLGEAVAPPADVRLALDGVAEAAPSVGVDLSDSPSGLLVPERHQPIGRQAIGVQLFGDEFEGLGRSRPIARDGRQSVIMILIFFLILILILFLILILILY